MQYKCKRCHIMDTAIDMDEIIAKKKLCSKCLDPYWRESLHDIDERTLKLIIQCQEPECGADIIVTNKTAATTRKYCNKCRKDRQIAHNANRQTTPVLRAKPEPQAKITLVCEYCKEDFEAGKPTVRFCKKPKCIQVGVKIRKLERDAKAIESLAKDTTIAVYGANRYKGKNFIHEKSRKHID